MDFTGKMICRRSQASVGTLAKWRIYRMKLNTLIGDIVIGAEPGRSGVVIVKFPGRYFARGVNGAADFNNSRRTEIGPGKILLTCPDNLYRALGCCARRAASRAASPGVYHRNRTRYQA